MKLIVKGLIAILIIVVAVLALVLTRPDEASFKSWAKSSLKPAEGSVMEKAKGQALSTEARWTADYADHVLWATVDSYQGTSRQRFLGVAGFWFRLGAE